jgi:hypothetical protein
LQPYLLMCSSNHTSSSPSCMREEWRVLVLSLLIVLLHTRPGSLLCWPTLTPTHTHTHVQRRLGAASRAEDAGGNRGRSAGAALIKYVDMVAAHPAFKGDGVATPTGRIAPFLRAACAEAAATGVGRNQASGDERDEGGQWLDSLIGAAVASSCAPNGSGRCEARPTVHSPRASLQQRWAAVVGAGQTGGCWAAVVGAG